MNFLCVEINHNSLSLNQLQEIMPDEVAVQTIYNELYAPDNEVFILKTCFRFLIFTKNICKLTLDVVLNKANIKEGIEVYSELEAIERLFTIASGLDSPFLGEGEIVAQFKNSIETASQRSALGTYLQQILKSTLSTGKRVRHETALGNTSSAYSSIAAQLIKSHNWELTNKQAVILGTGELAQQLYNYFSKKCKQPILVCSASNERAVAFCENRNALPFNEAIHNLAACDLILAASNNLNKMALTGNANQIIIDFGMPANVIPDENCIYYSMEDVKQLQESKNQTKLAAVNDAKAIINEEMKALEFWLKSRKVVPLIIDYKNKAENIKQEEWEWAKNRLGDLSGEQVIVLQKMMNRMVNRLTSRPVSIIKDFAQCEQKKENINTFKEIFDL